MTLSFVTVWFIRLTWRSIWSVFLYLLTFFPPYSASATCIYACPCHLFMDLCMFSGRLRSYASQGKHLWTSIWGNYFLLFFSVVRCSKFGHLHSRICSVGEMSILHIMWEGVVNNCCIEKKFATDDLVYYLLIIMMLISALLENG